MDRAPANLASQILSDLSYGDMTIPVGRFNDDDFYLVHPLTKEVKRVVDPSQRAVTEQPRTDGLTWVRGMRAKHMGLWQLPAGARRSA